MPNRIDEAASRQVKRIDDSTLLNGSKDVSVAFEMLGAVYANAPSQPGPQRFTQMQTAGRVPGPHPASPATYYWASAAFNTSHIALQSFSCVRIPQPEMEGRMSSLQDAEWHGSRVTRSAAACPAIAQGPYKCGGFLFSLFARGHSGTG